MNAKPSRRVPRLSPAVAAFARLIRRDGLLRQTLEQAMDEAAQPGSVDTLMARIDQTTRTAFPFTTDLLVGCPLNRLLAPIMATPSGRAFFRAPAVNARIRAVLNSWAAYLDSPASRTFLNRTDPTGWFSDSALAEIDMDAFQCNPEAPHWGFDSWNGYFTRAFRQGARPVAAPGDDRTIVAACEATPYAIAREVRLTDRFWMKAQPYSLTDIFTPRRAALARAFEGGDVYQGFLSAHNYHRWNAPVAGEIVAAYRVPGTYFADLPGEPEAPSLDGAQAYLTAVASRAVVVIRSPVLGLVACVFVGMAEISTCRIDVAPGQQVAKGQHMGQFQYGGSTHCLIFQPGAVREFLVQPGADAGTVNVSTPIALA